MSALRFEAWGSGDVPLLLLHGFTGNRESFVHLRPRLEPCVAAIAVDLPGHGDSPCPAGLTFEGVLEELGALLDAQASRRFVVMGYSQGARIALALALARPDSVAGLVLESGSPGLSDALGRARRRAADGRLARDLERHGVGPFVARWERQPVLAGLSSLPLERAQRLRARRLGADPLGLAAALRAMGLGAQPSLWAHLPKVSVPTLLISGERDPKYTAIARAMSQELPLAWMVRLAGAGHAPHLEVPEAFAEEVVAFLSALGDAQRPGEAWT